MKRLTTDDVMTAIETHGDSTRKDLADRLNTNKQTVRYHLRHLLRGGRIQVVRTSSTHASELKWYGIPKTSLGAIRANDRLAQRLRAAVELEMQSLLDLWGPWTATRLPNAMLQDIDDRIRALESHEQAALAVEHKAALVWRFARIDQAAAYRSALNRILDR